jgi:hypothetical protein
VAKSTFTLEWQAPEHEHKERTADWFWVSGIIVAALALVSIIFGNIILAVLIVISAFSLALFINRPPENLDMALTEVGVRKEDVLYPFETLASFWIDTEHPHKKIILRSKKQFMPLIIIPISDDVSVEELRAELIKHMPEEYHSLPFVEKLLEYLGF